MGNYFSVLELNNHYLKLIISYSQPILFSITFSFVVFNHSYEKVVGGSFSLLCSVIQAQDNLSHSILKFGGGCSRDFPGLSGYALTGGYAYSLSDNLEGGFGVKRLNMSGYPRTPTVNEFTKAITLDFHIYFLPLANEFNILKIGLGYSFSFYKTRRSYPVVKSEGLEKEVTWPIQDANGCTSGVMLTGEYECLFFSKVSLGIKASLCKASDRVFYVGPFLGICL